MAAKPTMEKLMAALVKLQNGKAGGSSRILPETLKAGCCTEDRILDPLAGPRDWSDAILIPIPKKGDLSICDNGEESPFWKRWEKWWLESCRKGYSR